MKFKKLFNDLFGKKENKVTTNTDVNTEALIENLNVMTQKTVSSANAIVDAMKDVKEKVKREIEIERLKKIQSQTKKQRTKNKLQKRIDAYGK